MRKIKFRVYDKENKIMNYLDLEDLCEDDYWFDGETEVWNVLHDCNNEQEKFVLMQYTGLKDKNGKEIYEGDIIFVKGETKLLDIKGKVEYSNILAQFIITNTGNIVNEAEPLGDYEEEDIEKIGNVYDNPELLEEGE